MLHFRGRFRHGGDIFTSKLSRAQRSSSLKCGLHYCKILTLSNIQVMKTFEQCKHSRKVECYQKITDFSCTEEVSSTLTCDDDDLERGEGREG